MKILVTGGLGFIGSHFVNSFSNKYKIVIVDNLSTGKLENVIEHPNVQIIEGDITNYLFIKQIFDNYNFDGVIHLAAIASVQMCQEQPLETSEVNFKASQYLLDLSLKHHIKKFVFASSAAVYGDNPDLPKCEETSIPVPVSFYGVDKYAIERNLLIYTKISKMHGTAFRFFNVFGPKQDPHSPYSGVLSIFMNEVISSDEPILNIYGDGTQTRDFIYVTDLIQGINQALEDSSMNGQVFNLGMGKETSLLDIIKSLEDISGKKIKTQFKNCRTGDIKRSYCDNQKIRTHGFKIRKNLYEGLSDFYKSRVRESHMIRNAVL